MVTWKIVELSKKVGGFGYIYITNCKPVLCTGTYLFVW